MNLTDEEREALVIARKDANEILPLMDSVDTDFNNVIYLLKVK